MSRAACWKSRAMKWRLAAADPWHLGRMAASSGGGSPSGRRRADRRRCWCFRRRPSHSARPRRWRSRHFKAIASASDLTMIVFQYPLATGQGYPAETLSRLLERNSYHPRRQGLDAKRCSTRGACEGAAIAQPAGQCAVNQQRVATEFARAWCNGLLSGSGSVIADLQARRSGRSPPTTLAEARGSNDRIPSGGERCLRDPSSTCTTA